MAHFLNALPATLNYIWSIYDTKCNRDDRAKPCNNEPLQMTSAAVGGKIEIKDVLRQKLTIQVKRQMWEK